MKMSISCPHGLLPTLHLLGVRLTNRRLECPNCGTVIEAKEELETLVEVFLRLGRLC